MSLGPIDICFSCDMGECHKCDGRTIMGHICQHGCSVKEFAIKDYRIVYHKFWDFFDMIPNSNGLRKMATDNYDIFVTAPGSSNNHQAWEGGYLHHIVETLNIAVQMYDTLNQLRPLPFKIEDVLTVMMLHDIEKPWKHKGIAMKTKQARRDFRAGKIVEYGIELTPEQENALRYVEGVPDSEYTPGERTMNELAALCHCCDILSARLWYDRGDGKKWDDKKVAANG